MLGVDLIVAIVVDGVVAGACLARRARAAPRRYSIEMIEKPSVADHERVARGEQTRPSVHVTAVVRTQPAETATTMKILSAFTAASYARS